MSPEQMQALAYKHGKTLESVMEYAESAASLSLADLQAHNNVSGPLIEALKTAIEAFKAIPFVEAGNNDELIEQFYTRLDDEVLIPLMKPWGTKEVNKEDGSYRFVKLPEVSEVEFRIAVEFYKQVVETVHELIGRWNLMRAIFGNPAWDMFTERNLRQLERDAKNLAAERELLEALIAERNTH